MSVLIRNARLVTPGAGPARGGQMSALRVIPAADVLVAGGVVSKILPADGQPRDAETVIDAAGRVLMPGFVDCHTHACFAGSRLDEWERKLKGATYQEIMASGGGIMSTVRAVRAATEQELTDLLSARLDAFLRAGTTTVEIKSGYGLTTHDELKMLRAVRRASRRWPGTVVATALPGHAIDPDAPDFVERTIHETLDAVHAEFPAVAIDAYLEKGAWSLVDARRLLTRARDLGHPVRLHADQFTSLGGIELAIGLGAASVDHLEASTPDDLSRFGPAATTAVGLPICGLHLDGRYADLRRVVDAGGAAAIATNFNPGSAPSQSMPLAIAVAVRACGLTPAEAVTASTVNGAHVLGLADRGAIEPGKRADLILLEHRDERQLAYELGGNPVDVVICAGSVVRRRGFADAGSGPAGTE